jgi:hypothetical protein
MPHRARAAEDHEGKVTLPATRPTPAPDPVVAPDAGQFFRVVLLDHIATCAEEDCGNDTRCAAESSDTEAIPYCAAHLHVVFADWMVGV